MDEILTMSKMDRKNYSSLSPNLLTDSQNAQIKKVKSEMIIRVTLIWSTPLNLILFLLLPTIVFCPIQLWLLC